MLQERGRRPATVFRGQAGTIRCHTINFTDSLRLIHQGRVVVKSCNSAGDKLVVVGIRWLHAGKVLTMSGKRWCMKSVGRLLAMSAPAVVLLLSLQLAGVADPGGQSPVEEQSPVTVAEQLSEVFRRVAIAVRPSVVRVSVTLHQRGDKVSGNKDLSAGGFSGPGKFRKGELWAAPFDKSQKQPEHTERPEQSEQPTGGHGTGVIIGSDGLIVTNAHVVNGAGTLQVTLDDRRTYDAEIVATDEETDLAVIRIDAQGLKPVTFGDSDAVQVGDWVIAIGSPFGLDQTVTAGIISAKGRSGVGVAEFEDFLQTDAPINPGNSGGPLLNLRGEVIGINTAIATRTGENAGVGFSIPGRLAERVATSLKNAGHVERGQIGAVIQPLTPKLAESFSFQGEGVLVAQVLPGSAAEQAGLQSGDIITRFGERTLQNPSDLRNEVANTTPGKSVTILIIRDGKEVTVSLQIGRRYSESISTAAPRGKTDQPDPVQRLGLIPGNTSSDDTSGKALPAETSCVIGAVIEESPAARAGLCAGDTIVSVNGESLKNFADFSEYLQQHRDVGLLRLLIVRDGRRQFVILETTDK